MKKKLLGFLNTIEVDRAVFFGVLAKVWSVFAGPLTALLIVIKFSPECQGYYYTFASLLALQVFIELGLGTVIIQFASHEWSHLRMDDSGNITGEKQALSRLASLAEITFRWYLVGGIVVMLGLGIGGYFFFHHSAKTLQITWFLPWLSLCFFTGTNVCLIPVWSILEGCNQVSSVYAYRFLQGVIASVVIWLSIFFGANLWSASISSAATFLCGILFLRFKYGNFIRSLLLPVAPDARIGWRREILPMQWRIALSWISGYFVFSLFTPVIFRYYGPVVAGQFGMTWSLVSVASRISNSWLYAKVPKFGMFIAKKEYRQLDSLFEKLTKIFFAITILAAILVWLVIYLLFSFKHPFVSRLLPIFPMSAFLSAEVIMMLSVPFTMYLFAHKKNPLFVVSILTGMAVCVSTLVLGKYFSVTAIALGYLSINIFILALIVAIWHRCKKEWHSEDYAEQLILDKGIIADEAL